MRTLLVILLVLANFPLAIDKLHAGSYTYLSSESEDIILSLKANEDSIDQEEAFSRIVRSALAQIAEQVRRQQEQQMTEDARHCAEQGKVFTVDTTQGRLQWQCK